MENLVNFFTQTGTVQSILFISLAIFIGIGIGKIKLFKIQLGIAGVLFTGLAVGHFGIQINPKTLHFVKEFGLILFVYSIGLEVGPGFVSSLKKEGMKMNTLASLIVFLGLGIAVIIHFITGIPIETMAGILCGAVTNTPSLGAAQQVITDMGTTDVGVTGMAYAVAYPFGIIGIILTMILIRVIFRIKVNQEEENYTKEAEENQVSAETFSISINNPQIIGKTQKELSNLFTEPIVISRIARNGEVFVPKPSTCVAEGDKINIIAPKDSRTRLQTLFGEISNTNMCKTNGKLAMRRMIVTQKAIAGKTIAEVNIFGRYNANITRIYRSGIEMIPTLESTLEIGDYVRVVGETKQLPEIANELGNSPEALNHPNILPMFLGIFLGILLGSIPINIPGIPAPVKLGLAGGPLLVAILLGRMGRVGKLSFYLPPGASLVIREVGIVLFLVSVGIGSGGKFIHSLVHEGGVTWMGYGALITFIPLFITAILARLWKVNYLSICGLLAGSMTDPPALEFANNLSSSQAQSYGYASVYPLVMFLRILCIQILILLV
ncbi:MAG: putative transporter [Bacteroidales bacterium]